MTHFSRCFVKDIPIIGKPNHAFRVWTFIFTGKTYRLAFSSGLNFAVNNGIPTSLNGPQSYSIVSRLSLAEAVVPRFIVSHSQYFF